MNDSASVQVIDLDKQYGEQIFNYVKDVLLADIDPTPEEMTHAYANIRLWLDDKGVTSDGTAYIHANQEEAKKIATGQEYEKILEAKEVSKNTSASMAGGSSVKRLAVIAALIAFAFWYLFKDSDTSTAE